MKLRLVSFAMCPYAQRAVIVLREKNAEFDTTYIDLQNKPEWFLAISPRGKVPVLEVDGVPIFESSAICELLDEIGPPPRLLPDDPILRARDRGWFQFADELFVPIYRLLVTPDQQVFDESRQKLDAVWRRLEREMAGRSWLSGDGSRFGMADAAVAPAFTRVDLLSRIGAYDIPADCTAMKAWGGRILARDSVRRSVPDTFETTVRDGMRTQNAIAARGAA